MREFEEYFIETQFNGLTVKEYVRSVLKISARNFQKLTRARGLLINGKVTNVERKVRAGDSLKVIVLREKNNLLAQDSELEIEVLYEDSNLLIVNKPAGILVHPAGRTTHGTLLNFLANKYQKQPEVQLHAIHRLDRDTTGCVMIAKNVQAKKLYELQLQEGAVKRTYVAIVQGDLLSDQGEIVAKIAKDPKSPNRRIVSEGGKNAVTRYQVREKLTDDYKLLELELLTGRTHQIRVHLTHIGLPILGDLLYGTKNPAFIGQALHAEQIKFIEHKTGEMKKIKAPFPKDMLLFISKQK